MTALATFQDEFARAVTATGLPPGLPPAIRRIAAQPGFAVYRNTVMKGWIDAVEANYPAILAIVGEDWFRAAASVFVRGHPPRLPVMSLYGDNFAEFLTKFPPGADMPFLGPVAAIDRAWTLALAAPDAARLDRDALAGFTPTALAQVRLTLHPSVRIAWFDTTSPSIWLDARGFEETDELSFAPVGEGIFIGRAVDGMAAMRLTAGPFAYVAALAAGKTLGDAASEAISAEPALDLAAFTTTLLELGAFSAAVPAPFHQGHSS